MPVDITTLSPTSSVASLFIPIPPETDHLKSTNSLDQLSAESPYIPSRSASPLPISIDSYGMFGPRSPRNSRPSSPRRARSFSRDLHGERRSRSPSTASSDSSRSRSQSSSRSRSYSPPRRARPRRSLTPPPVNPPLCGTGTYATPAWGSAPVTIVPHPACIWPPAPKPVEILTYSYQDKMAYVPAGPSYEDALNHAQEVYPALALVERHRISFHVTGRDQLVRVPKLAWADLLLDLPKYEVMYVEVDDDAPPKYQGKRQSLIVGEKEKECDKPSSSKGGIVGWFKALFGRGA